jgi:hypothetical protein
MRLLYWTFLTFFVTVVANAQVNPEVSRLLNQSIFAGELPPREVAPGVSYNPVVVSVVASLKSRQYEKDLSRWEELSLPATPNSICPGTMKAYFKRSASGSPYTFVVLPGSYATWKRGSFSNQTAAVLDSKFDDPNLVAFAGYLSPEFLHGTCNKIPWDGIKITSDFYVRLARLLAEVGAKSTGTGLIGFSGGAFLTIGLLAADSDSVRAGGNRVFGLGGMSFSPILHGRTTFNNLDSKFKASRIDKSLGLTTMDLGNI